MNGKKASSNILPFNKMDKHQREEIATNLLKITLSSFKLRDPYTSNHNSSVADISVNIGKELGLDSDQILGLKISAMLHDIGKLGVPMAILNKPGTLYPHELEVIKAHVKMGVEIFSDIELPWPVIEVIGQHHERLDGSGYPNNLKGESICLEARIVAIADVFDAISTDRPYRDKLGRDYAQNVILRNKGIKYDKDACDAFLKCIKRNII